MNDQQLAKKVRQDATQVKKALINLVEDSRTRFSKGFKKLTGDARETVVDVAASVQKNVGHGLSQYNTKAQKVVDKVPGGFAKMAAKYSWVAIAITLTFGILLGSRLLKPTQQPLG